MDGILRIGFAEANKAATKLVSGVSCSRFSTELSSSSVTLSTFFEFFGAIKTRFDSIVNACEILVLVNAAFTVTVAPFVDFLLVMAAPVSGRGPSFLFLPRFTTAGDPLGDFFFCTDFFVAAFFADDAGDFLDRLFAFGVDFFFVVFVFFDLAPLSSSLSSSDPDSLSIIMDASLSSSVL